MHSAMMNQPSVSIIIPTWNSSAHIQRCLAHLSLVPLDLAGSGVLSVTNTFGIKSSESLVKISRNIIPVRPSISSIVEGLHLAKSRIYNYEDRIQNARLNWAKNWDESYHQQFVEKLNAWVLELQRPE